MFTSRRLVYALIVGALTLTAVTAYAWDPRKPLDNVVPPPPKIDITVNPKKPLTPLKVEVETPDGKLKVEPSPVPSPPVVHANGNGFFDKVINKTNDIAQKPKNWIDQKGREINDGFIHLGNEIGMMWAKFKHNVEKQVADWIQWLKDLAMKYGIYALAGIGALFLVRGFFGFLFGRRHGSRTKFAGYHA